jgi:hypothetical protein
MTFQCLIDDDDAIATLANQAPDWTVSRRLLPGESDRPRQRRCGSIRMSDV